MSVRTDWRKLPISLNELCISTVLRSGQSFRWKLTPQNEWTCALHGRILTLRQDPTHLHYRATFPHALPAHDDTPALLHDYFNLSVPLTSLYTTWASRDPHFAATTLTRFQGIRILRQDPWENLVAFICSSNNHISRISGMVQKLCSSWGERIPDAEGEEVYYDFPAPEKLAAVEGLEGRLREMGFGYRAGYIARTSAMVVQEREAGWLEGLRKVPYKQAKEELVKLQGVGPKVADCVCLMSLDKMEAVPVDTHVLQIAQNNYGFGKTKNKTLTKATYDAIGDHFRELWGKEAGWAHSVLFTAELRSFAEVKGEVKNEVKSEESGGDDKKVTVKAVKRTRTVKVKKEPKVKKEAQVKQEVQVKKEENEDNESSTVTEKRKVKIEEVDVKDDEMLMSLADRVKRRRRG